jgi:hypothetical protein
VKPELLYGPESFRSDEAYADYVRLFVRIPAPAHAALPDDLTDDGRLASERPLSEVDLSLPFDFKAEVLDQLRDSVYLSQRFIFLGHIVRPSGHRRLPFEVAIFLTGDGDLTVVARARFYLGPAWRSKIFEAELDANGRLGIVTKANNGFLVLCELLLHDGSKLFLNHYCNVESVGPPLPAIPLR